MNKPFGTLLFVVQVCAVTAMAAEPARSGAPPGEKVLTLQEAIRLTLDRAPEVALATAAARRADEVLKETRSFNQPQIVTGTGLAYNNGFPLSIEGAAPSIFQIGITQSIFSKKNRNLILEAEAGSKASQLEPAAARNELAAKTALIYYEFHQLGKLKSLWSDRLAAAAKDQQIAESQLEAGKVKPLDVTLAGTATAFARQQLLVTVEQAKMAEVELRDLTGLPDSTPLVTADPQIEDRLLEQPSEDILRQALETSPEILQAEANLRAKEFHVQAEKGEGLPKLEIVSQYALFSRTNNYQDFFNKFTRNNFILGLSVQVPLFSGHRVEARVAQSRQEADEARYRLQRMKSDLKLGIERSLSALRIARGALEFAGKEVSAARENLKVSETLLEGGRISTKDLELSRSQLREKEIARLEAEKNLFQRKIEVLKVAGSLASLF